MSNNKILIDNIKNWIQIDDEIKDLLKVLRKKRIEKKEYSKKLINIMKTNEIDAFDITNGKLSYNKSHIKTPLSKKHLLTSLKNFFGKDEKTINSLSEYILNSRKEKILESIKRK